MLALVCEVYQSCEDATVLAPSIDVPEPLLPEHNVALIQRCLIPRACYKQRGLPMLRAVSATDAGETCGFQAELQYLGLVEKALVHSSLASEFENLLRELPVTLGIKDAGLHLFRCTAATSNLPQGQNLTGLCQREPHARLPNKLSPLRSTGTQCGPPTSYPSKTAAHYAIAVQASDHATSNRPGCLRGHCKRQCRVDCS